MMMMMMKLALSLFIFFQSGWKSPAEYWQSVPSTRRLSNQPGADVAVLTPTFSSPLLIYLFIVSTINNRERQHMAASPPLFYSCSPRIISRRNTNHHNPPSSSSTSCSSSPYSSSSNFSSHRPGRYSNFITFSGNLPSLPLSLSLKCVHEVLLSGFSPFCDLQAMELWNFWSFVIGVLVFYCKPSSCFSCNLTVKCVWKFVKIQRFII